MERIPRFVKVPGKPTVSVYFMPTRDHKGSDNPVTFCMARVFEEAVRRAANSTILTALTVTATTNGVHASNSLHPSGRAIDIGAVNNMPISRMRPDLTIKAVQEAFAKDARVCQNFGPAMMASNGEPLAASPAHDKLKEDHRNHIHIGVIATVEEG